MITPADNKQRIIDAALQLADAQHWEAVRLRDIADLTGLSLDEIRQHFPEKEALTEAFFDRADQAMLAAAETEHFRSLDSTDRVHLLIMTWLNALESHHRIVRQMLANKLEPGHLQVQVPAVLRISRTVQWVREAAGRNATYMRRALEETALTGIYLTTFAYWLAETSTPANDTGYEARGARRTAARPVELSARRADVAGSTDAPRSAGPRAGGHEQPPHDAAFEPPGSSSAAADAADTAAESARARRTGRLLKRLLRQAERVERLLRGPSAWGTGRTRSDSPSRAFGNSGYPGTGPNYS